MTILEFISKLRVGYDLTIRVIRDTWTIAAQLTAIEVFWLITDCVRWILWLCWEVGYRLVVFWVFAKILHLVASYIRPYILEKERQEAMEKEQGES